MPLATNIIDAPALTDEQFADIRAALEAAHSDWTPTAEPTGITYTDIFCGFGGSSIGLENAGLELALGANHWDLAIATHALNFPDADHIIADVSNYDMRRMPHTDVLWASPICTELSPAGGTAAPRTQLSLLEEEGHVPSAGRDRTRATFWDVLRATEIHRYKIIIVENVVEASRWELFDVWLNAMDTLGYTHQFISVSSAHIGDETNPFAPQWRDRMYFLFARRGVPMPEIRPRPLAWCQQCDEINPSIQAWKRPDRRRIGKYRQQYVYRCPNMSCRHSIVEPFVLPAAAAIDWSNLGERIGDRRKPLAAATMRRIRAGIDRFAQPTVVSTNHGADGENRSYPVLAAPMPTRSTKIGDGMACPPFLVDRRGYDDGDDRRIKPIDEPVGAITANGRPHTLVIPPMLVPAGGTWNDDAASAAEPMRARTTRDTEGLLTPEPWITVLRNHADVTRITEPLATVTTGSGGGGHQALTIPPNANPPGQPTISLVIPFRKGSAKTTGEPLHTVATRDSAGLVSGASIDIADCRFRMLTPREHARAQRFPDTYRAMGNKSEQTMGFGNAVSSNVAQWLGGHVVRLLA